MGNSTGLLVVGLGIALVVALVTLVDWMARNRPHTKIGRICRAIDGLIGRLPDD